MFKCQLEPNMCEKVAFDLVTVRNYFYQKAYNPKPVWWVSAIVDRELWREASFLQVNQFASGLFRITNGCCAARTLLAVRRSVLVAYARVPDYITALN